MNLMLDVIFILGLVVFNATSFLLLDVRQWTVFGKRKTLVLFTMSLLLLLVAVYLDHERYVVVVNLSIALILLMGFRLLLFKFFPRQQEVSPAKRAVQKFFDHTFIPFFVGFVTLLECVFLLIVRNN
jgi:hypothetical protein